MLRSVVLRSPANSSLLFESVDFQRIAGSSRSCSTICNSHGQSVPKLDPFNRRKIDRGVREPSLLKKSESQLADYCATLEGDQAYSCWRAYFELKDLEEECPKDDVENVVRQIDGVKSLVDCLHGISAIQKKKKEEPEKSQKTPSHMEKLLEEHFPIPDGLPKSLEELEEEEKARMPDSPFTRLLRSKGKHPAWFSEAPDHETD